MNGQTWRAAILGIVLTLLAAIPAQTVGNAQTPVTVADPQTWEVMVNNVSPEGENWSFNAFYPDNLQVHPGDTIVFKLAPNPNAYHTAMVLVRAMTPMEMYQGFAGGYVLGNPAEPDSFMTTFFNSERGDPLPPCGRAGQDPCPVAPSTDVEFGFNSGVLVNPPAEGGEGHTSFAVTLAPELPPGPYYFTSLVDGPSMSGRIDVVAPDQPVQSADALLAMAERQYQADLAWLATNDRVGNPPESSNPDGTKTWQVAAGRGGSSSHLSINEFSPSQMVITAGDTVTWTNHGPSAVPHLVSGFGTDQGSPPDLDPYQPACTNEDGSRELPPPGTFPTDIWNTCPGAEVNSFTEFSQPSHPSGDPYTEGPRTSGILLPQPYLDSPIGDGLPFTSSYSITFPEPGTYTYECPLHPGMVGTVVVAPRSMPR
jgi:plastocyanin